MNTLYSTTFYENISSYYPDFPTNNFEYYLRGNSSNNIKVDNCPCIPDDTLYYKLKTITNMLRSTKDIYSTKGNTHKFFDLLSSDPLIVNLLNNENVTLFVPIDNIYRDIIVFYDIKNYNNNDYTDEELQKIKELKEMTKDSNDYNNMITKK